MSEEVPTGIEEYLDYCFEKYFEDLIEQFHMSEPRKDVSGLGALYEASAQNLRIRLVNDRGVTSFEVASVHQPNDFRDVELIAELFREASEQRKGIIRLNLSEQANLLEKRWNELNEMFEKEHVSDTHAQLLKLGIQRSKFLFG